MLKIQNYKQGQILRLNSGQYVFRHNDLSLSKGFGTVKELIEQIEAPQEKVTVKKSRKKSK